jgi:hypothetical protein
MRESVVLPAPDGEDRTSINPRRAIETFGPGGFGSGCEAVFLLLLALFLVSAFLVSVSAFLPPVFVRPVFFWPALAAGVLAILTPPKCPA